MALNLGVPGASNDAIVRLLHLAVPVLQPDVVLVLFTHVDRREYLAPHNRYLRYAPNSSPEDAVSREIASHFDALSSSYDDRLNLFRNYKSAEALLAGRHWCYSLVKPEDLSMLGSHLDPVRRARRHGWLDVARDHAHPGPETHASLCEGYWEAFERSGGYAALAAKPRSR